MVSTASSIFLKTIINCRGILRMKNTNSDSSRLGDSRLGQGDWKNTSLKERDLSSPPPKDGRVEHYLRALHSKVAGKRRQAASTLGKLGDPRAVEPLIRALQDQSFGVRSCAALSLGLLRDARALEPLIEALHDEHNLVRNQAALALGILGDPRAITPLNYVLQDRDYNVRKRAELALLFLGNTLVEEAHSEPKRVRRSEEN
jgi:HEAT repeat protein